MNNRIGQLVGDFATGAGFLISSLVVLIAVVYGVFGWFALIYGAGMTAGLAIHWLDRRRRFLPETPGIRQIVPWVTGAAVAFALLVLLHPFIRPEFSWSNLLFIFEAH